MKTTITFLILFLLFQTIQAQKNIDNNQKNPLNTFNIEADAISAALSLNREIKNQLNIGIGVKMGYSMNLSYTESLFYQYNEILGVFLFNRFSFSNNFEFDLGARASYALLVDYNPDHGFSHLGFLGLYGIPMVGWRNFQFGAVIGIGWTRSFTTYLTPVIRYKISF
jgi:hypothetical protein